MYQETAQVYDLIYDLAGKDYRAEAEALAAAIRRRRRPASTLLDVACGTGRHLAHLRESFEVTGLDLSEAMLDQARRRLADVELVQADMREFDLGRRFDAVVCLFGSIGYMADRGELTAAVQAMADHLEPDGVLVIDGWVRPEAWQDPGIVTSVSGMRDDLAVARVVRTHREGRRSHLEMHYLLGRHDGIEHLVDHHALTLFTTDDYLGAFDAASLSTEVVEGPTPHRDRYVGVRATPM